MVALNGHLLKSGFICITFSLIIISSYFPPTSIGGLGWKAIFITIFAITLWITKVISTAVTSIVVIVLFSVFHVLTFEEAASTLGNEIIWLIITMLIMGYAVHRIKLDKRLAIFIVSYSRGKVIYIYLSFIILAFILTFIIPTAMGRLTIMMPIALGFINSFENQIDTNFSKSIMLIVTIAPYLSTISVLTGAGGTIYSISLFKSMVGYEWNYLHWLVVMMPIAVIILMTFWFLIIYLFPSKKTQLFDIDGYLKEERLIMGKISTAEIKLIILYFILITLWATKELHGMSISMSAVLITPIMFFPKIDIIKWEDVRRNIDWGVPLLFAAGFSIALALEKSGVIDALKVILMNYSKVFSGYFFPIMLVLLLVFLRTFFTNFTAMVASLMPVTLSFAISSQFNPIWIGMLFIVASSTSFLLPSQSTGNMITFSTNYYSSRDLLIIGSLVTLLLIIITLIMAFYYWPSVGIPIL